MGFGTKPADLSGWEDKDEILLFAQDASLSGQFAQQWKLGVTAREAAMREVANNMLRRLLAHNKSFEYTDVHIGDAALFYMAMIRRGAPRCRGPAKILDIDETGVTVKFRSQTFKVAQ